jgi:predicted nucleotidyltransferase
MKAETVEVDEALFEVLSAFSAAAAEVKAPWLVIGATARIMLLEQIYAWPQGIGTQDIDFAVQVGDWEHYKLLCEYITKADVYAAERKPAKRFRSKEDTVFDLVPYGGVENEAKQVFWPPDNDDVMTVRGFESAAKDAVSVIVNQKLKIRVVSPRGLCALKFLPGRNVIDNTPAGMQKTLPTYSNTSNLCTHQINYLVIILGRLRWLIIKFKTPATINLASM